MKRHIHPLNNPNITLWEAICDIDNLKLAHKNARKGKGWYNEVKMVNENEGYYLTLLQNMLLNRTYKTSKYKTFLKKDGDKYREIYKLPYFPDRICQWAILQIIEPIIIKNLTNDTYSAIPNRGIHLLLKRIKKNIKGDKIGTKYCLKLDVRKYYPSISHEILKEKYKRLFKDDELLLVLNEIIDSTDDEIGIPIGNYLSQYSGNYYLSAFDHWIKEDKKIKYYYRYMDDIVILHQSKEYLHSILSEIDFYFKTKLELAVKNNWQVFPVDSRGIDFVGYRIFSKYILLRKSICKRMKSKMTKIKFKINNKTDIGYSELCSVNSYGGWLKHCDGNRLYEKYIKPIQEYRKGSEL